MYHLLEEVRTGKFYPGGEGERGADFGCRFFSTHSIVLLNVSICMEGRVKLKFFNF